MTGMLVFLLMLGVLIFVHELGHFIVAKLCGIYVDRFSLGFPPRLFGIRWGETDYCVGLLPIGGYVKMAGQEDTPQEKRDEINAKKGDNVIQDSSVVVRSELHNAIRDPSRLGQLEKDRGCGGLNQTFLASQHDALDGVAPAVRNSHQINQRLPKTGRASHAWRERYLAKECFGSNRALTRTIATSRCNDDRHESHQYTVNIPTTHQ